LREWKSKWGRGKKKICTGAEVEIENYGQVAKRWIGYSIWRENKLRMRGDNVRKLRK